MRIARIAIVLFIIATIIGSCQNELEDVVTPIEPEDTTQLPIQGKLLSRIVSRNYGHEDSTQHEYKYDAHGRLVKATIKSIGNLQDIGYTDSEDRIYRNSDGLVKRWVEVSTTYQANVVVHEDSSVCEMMYDAGSKKYRYSIHVINAAGSEFVRIRDSISYTYNTKAQISVVQVFRKDKTTGIYFEAQRAEYEYDAVGNVIRHRYNENYENTGEPLSETQFEYDSKISSFITIGDIGLLRGYLTIAYPSVNNPVRSYNSSSSQPYVYIYNQHNQPTRLTVQSTDDQEESFVTNFYYMP